jgi:hypothetical protein
VMVILSVIRWCYIKGERSELFLVGLRFLKINSSNKLCEVGWTEVFSPPDRFFVCTHIFHTKNIEADIKNPTQKKYKGNLGG